MISEASLMAQAPHLATVSKRCWEIWTTHVCRLALGIALYRSSHFAETDAALVAATRGEDDVLLLVLVGPSSFFRAMILFRQGKPDEARKLAAEGVRVTRFPRDEKNPLAGRVT